MVRVISYDDAEIPYRRRSVDGVSLFIVSAVMDVVTDAADEAASRDLETMGVMIGRIYRDDNGKYAVFHRTITSDLVADAVHVRFDKTSMDDLIDAVDDMAEDERIIGWYHSHPGYGVFMSETDVRTQHSLFGKDMGFALVVDPLRGEFAVFDNSEIPEKISIVMME